MEVFYNVQIILRNDFGDFLGKKAKISQKQYNDLIDMSRKFHLGGFELSLEDDTFMVFPPDIVKKSILIIKKEVI